MNRLTRQLSRVFDTLESWWDRFLHRGTMGGLLVVAFLGALVVIEMDRQGLLPRGVARLVTDSHFGAVGFAFTLLLVVEILGLVFALAHSVATSVGMQFELFSLILLRKAFVEFGVLTEPLAWGDAAEPMFIALADVAGGLLIFVAVGFYYRLQRHVPITGSEQEQASFVAAKKIVALVILASFVAISAYDILHLVQGRPTVRIFHAFYTILVFSDILIVLIALMYSSRYPIVFRNSGFAAATVVLRLALVAPGVLSAALGVGATLLVIGLTAAYNTLGLETARRETV